MGRFGAIRPFQSVRVVPLQDAVGLGQAGELVAGVAGHIVVCVASCLLGRVLWPDLGQPLESRSLGLLCYLDFYTTPGEMGGGALGGSLQRAWRYEAPMTPFFGSPLRACC